ncbi:hypothetical protein [Haladaptatus sp. CMAA 1911]|uniref:hypothetical protein n=1 Tax=unclassified Haladaptatus TaxID=2622732 RepID=UPI003754DD4F
MNRRALLAGLAVPLVGGTAVVAQRFDYRRDKKFSIRTEPPITGHRFELVDFDERYASGDMPDDSLSNHANVEFDSADGRIRVGGRIPSGSRSCMETELRTVRYVESSDTLIVAVFDDYIHHDTCNLELGPILYVTDVRFESSLPSRVVVKHVTDDDGVVYEKPFSNDNRN